MPAEEAEADEENKMTAEDWAELGLAVAGFIPSLTISTAAAIGEAGLAVKQGDYLGAGISLLGGIPFVGGFVRVAKIVKKGKIARKILKVLNAGKKATKLKNVRRLPCIKPGVLSPEAAERLREWSRFGDRLVKVKEKTEG
ncbi:hypothetical protein [Pelosinus baikalensis]|uniref:Uncharacterized protein n=1 Tax=Pelosinus baikalensis TaxID=2892015 RepID=A0ABS8HKR7_9FIRM|nr:hypothetical protein [Pelosinus baikalensis]MCC5463771.1 hypothetical protein [Pelosinus baikalensis]